MNVLARILEDKRRDVARLRTAPRPRVPPPVRDVCAALARPPQATGRAPLRLLAEVKLRSPSAGPLSRALAPADRALAYARGGAAMVSVLCDAHHFDGGFEHLEEARTALDAAGLPVPLLAKEFVIDRVQLEEARARGADAALLVARIVTAAELGELAAAARGLGLEPLVEIADLPELDAALAAGARVIGVNARDLDTLRMDAERAARVLAAIPAGIVRVHLSGLRAPADVAAIAATGVDAALVGEALMRQDDPSPLLRALLSATA